jgi:hypothetical protein
LIPPGWRPPNPHLLEVFAPAVVRVGSRLELCKGRTRLRGRSPSRRRTEAQRAATLSSGWLALPS